MKRREAREIAFKLTYEMVVSGRFNRETLAELVPVDADCDSMNYINGIVDGIEGNFEALKAFVVKYSRGFEYDRIYKIDLALLLLAIYEIKFTDTPPAVAANEAVEISKIYSDVKSYSFINGILASVIAEVCDG